MKYQIYRFLFSAALIMATTSTLAQEVKEEVDSNHLSIDAQLMSRGEIRQGGISSEVEEKNENRSAFISNRARITVGYERDNLALKVAAQHQGVWGAEGGGKFNIYEAWAQIKANNGLFARLGRQELVYDDERILGNNDWAMAALYHDALKCGYENHGHKLHTVVAYNQNTKNINGGTFYKDGSQIYKTMQTVWYHYDVPKIPLGMSLLFINIGMQNGTEEDYETTFQQLIGGYVNYKPKNLNLEAAYYHQMGKASLDYTSKGSLPINAWMAAAKASYNFNNQLTGYVGYDYLSGDKEFTVPGHGQIGLVQHSKMSAFTTTFGSTHKFYGAMDFFYVSAYYGTFSPGLQNLFAGAVYKPFKGLSLDASYHYLATATELKGLEKTLGHEIELRASYKLMKDASISMGLSFMKGTETMEVLKRSTENKKLEWGWLMLNVSPCIFSGR